MNKGAERWTRALGRVVRRVRAPATTAKTVGTYTRTRPVPSAGCSSAAPAVCNKEAPVDRGRWCMPPTDASAGRIVRGETTASAQPPT